MKTFLLSIYFCFGLISPLSFTSTAQKTDRFKYYIIHDHSGSISKIDKQQNLKKMMLTLAEIAGKNISSASSFEIYSFGQDVEIKSHNTVSYDVDQDGTAQSVNEIIANINQFTNLIGNKTQKYSNLHTALNKMIGNITETINSTGEKPSIGVFIFTDGQLGSGDFSFADGDPLKTEITDASGYRKYVNSLITETATLTRKPVCLVQNTYEAVNLYYPGFEKLVKKTGITKDSLSLLNDSTVFYLKNTAEYSPDDKNNKYTVAFNDFIERANNYMIKSSQPVEATENPVVDKAVVTHNIASISEILKQEDLGSLSDILNGVPGLEEILPLLSAQKLNITQIKELRSFFEKVDFKKLIIAEQQVREKLAQKTSRQLTFDLKSLINVSSLSVAFKPAELTSTNLVTDNKGIRSLERDLIIGGADYIIERAKMEAIYSFLENIKMVLFDKNVHVRAIFPELTSILKDSTNFYDMSLLREALKRDLNLLPDNIMRNPDIYKSTEELTGLISILKLYKNIGEKQSFEQAFHDLSAELKRLNLENKKVVDAIYFTSNLIGYLTTNDLSNIYGNKTKLKQLSNALIVLSLDEATLADVTDINLSNSIDLIGNIFAQYKLVKGQIDQLSKASLPQGDFDQYRKMQADAILDVLGRSSDLVLTGFALLEELGYKTTGIDFITMQRNVKTCIEAYFLIKDKDYTQATVLLAPFVLKAIYSKEGYESVKKNINSVNEQVIAYKNALGILKQKQDSLKNTDQDLKPMLQAEINDLITKVADLKEQLPTLLPQVPGLQEYLNQKNLVSKILYAAGEVSESENSDDIKKIITKYALPVASYRIKRSVSPTIMLNAYLGTGLNFFTSKAMIRPMVSAPVGFEYSFKPNPNKAKSVSVLLSIFDLGNIISSQLWSSSTNTDDAVNFKNVVSPGAYISWGLSKKIPLSSNMGYAFNPGRISASLNFDLPLFSIYRGN